MAQGFVLGSGGGGGALEENTGSKTLPVFINGEGEAEEVAKKGTYQPLEVDISGNADTASKINTSSAIGSNIQPVYVNASGEVKAITTSTGSVATPVYFENGSIKACSATRGNTSTPVYLSNGEIKALTDTVGKSGNPVYLNSGKITACNSTLDVNINGNASTSTKVVASSSTETLTLVQGSMAASDTFTIKCGGTSDNGWAEIATYNNKSEPIYVRQYGSSTSDVRTAELLNKDGNTSFPGQVSATSGFKGNLDGNASTASTSSKVKGTATTEVMYVSGFVSPSTGADMSVYYNSSVYTKGTVLRNAAWNDYAEYRICKEKCGECVIETGFGNLVKSTKRLQKGACIISDTFGMAIGPEKDSQAVALCGRVLAIPDSSKFKVGDAVCSGKNGTVSKMNRLEIILFPDRIIGYVSEIPTYDEWNGIKTNGRIWIKVI